MRGAWWLLAASLAWAGVAGAAESTGAIGSASAHEGQPQAAVLEAEHVARHGGSFGDADDRYHYELLLETPSRLILYVNDEHNQPLDVRTLTGRWTLDPDARVPLHGAFTPSPDGTHFFASLPPTASNPLHVKVAVPKDGVWAELEFSLPR